MREPGLHSVGGVAGLRLQVTPTGARTWLLRVVIGTRRRDMGLGAYPGVTLAKAREKASAMRDQIDGGVDPIEARRAARSALIAEQAKALTFEEAAERFMDAKEAEWRNAKHRQQWRNTLKTYAYPVIGKLLVRDVEIAHVLKVLEPIWHDKTDTASKVRGRIEQVLDWARGRGYRSGDNPAEWKGGLDAQLADPSKIAPHQHHAALPIEDMADFMVKLRGTEGIGARALEIAILTAGRSGEVRGALWDEIDLDAKTWTIPETRMKAKRAHRVPLSPAAIKLLKALPRIQPDDPERDYVFPSPRGGQLSDMTLLLVMRRMGLSAVPHGFRSTFRDWAAERTNHQREVIEMALAHSVAGKVEAAYWRGDVYDKRSRLMGDWAAFLTTPVVKGKVIPMRLMKA